MAQESIEVSAFWPSRADDTLNKAAQRSVDLLSAMSAVHPALVHWFKPIRHRKDVLRPLLGNFLDQKEMADLLKQGMQLHEDSGKPWSELGFGVHAWNGVQKGRDSVGFSLTIGATGGSTNPNGFSLTITGEPGDPQGLYRADPIKRVVTAVADSLEPDVVTVTSLAVMQRLMEADEGATGSFGGWMAYVRDPKTMVAGLGVVIETAPRGGRLAVGTEEPFVASNDEHYRAAFAIHEALAPLRWSTPAGPR